MKKLIYTIFSLLLLFSCNKEIDTKNTGSYKDGLYHLSFDGGLGSDTKSLLNNSDNRFMNLYTEVYSECENLDSPETKHYYKENGHFTWENFGDNDANLVVSVFNKKKGTHLKWGEDETCFSKATTTIDKSLDRGDNWADITSVLGVKATQLSNANYADPVYCFAPYTDSTKISVDPSDNKNLIAEFKMPVSFIYDNSKTLEALKQYSYIYTTTKIAELPTTEAKKFKASESVFKAIPAIIKIKLKNQTGVNRTLMSFSVSARDNNGNVSNVFPIKLQYKINKDDIIPLQTEEKYKRAGVEIKFKSNTTINNGSDLQFYIMILPNDKIFINESLYFTVTTYDPQSISFSQYIVKRNEINLNPTGENKFKSGGIYTFNIVMKNTNEFVKNYKPETIILKDHNLYDQSRFSTNHTNSENPYISYDDFKSFYSNSISVEGKNYHTPTMTEFQTIFPVRVTYAESLDELSNDPETNNFCLKKSGNVLNLNEFMSIPQDSGTDKNFRVMADYRTGEYGENKAMYAIKKKRSTKGANEMEPYEYDKYRCAYLYFFEKEKNEWVLKVRMKYLGEFSPYTIDDVASKDFWDDGTPYFFTRTFSCNATNGNTTAMYWSKTYHSDGSGSTTEGQEMLCIDPEKGYVGIFDRIDPPSSAMLRLFEDN